MCDPIGIIGLGLSIGMQAMQASAQADMASKQQAANNQWLSYQRQKAREENIRQANARMRAEASRQESLGKLTPEEQSKAQGVEEQRLTTDYTPKDILVEQNPQLIGDKLLSGQGDMSNIIKSDFADKLTAASRDARSRIAALARVQSFGGSQFGLANRANDILGTSMQDIRLQGDIRQGSLAAYGAEKQVEPIRYAMGAGGGGFGSAAGGLAKMGGASLGTALAGGG